MDIKDGIYFKCIKCGKCCKDSTVSYVFLYEDEVDKIIKLLGISYSEFFKKYAGTLRAKYAIFEGLKATSKSMYLNTIILRFDTKNGRCIFLDDENRCQIYNARPQQCSAWPSWYQSLIKKGGFEESKEMCKGLWVNDDLENIDEDAEFIPYETIIKHVEEEVALEQNFIKKMLENDKDLKKVYPFLQDIDDKDIIEY